ncbi:metal-dependent hydrolase family protein [Euzebya rosea]|uniref:metal-dependent hydrolase family protein n=1 Tax=Euzebya rosea TaxID=2052804 RepID=UPI00196AB948|nr:amidohydrolase family protein [Euzebya rosea]
MTDISPSLAILGARVLDVDTATFHEQDVHVRDGRVVALGEHDGPDPDVVVEGHGRVVVPGLIDAHFHAYGIGLDMLAMEATPMSYVTAKAAQRLGGALRRGFTTVRDVAGGDIGLRRALDEGLFAGPRYLFTGPALSQTGGHGDPRPGDLAIDTCCHRLTEVVDGVDNLRVAVRERFRTGAHAIKVMTSGGVVSLTDPLRVPQYSAEEVRTVCDEATRRGSYVAAHAYSPEAIAHSVVNGVRSIEHGNLLDAKTAQLMAQHDAMLVPTLAAYDAMDRRGDSLGLTSVQKAKNLEVLHHGKQAIEIATDAGVPVGFGSDLMGDLEDDQLVGLRLQVEVQGALEALRSATTVNASLLGRPDLGRVAVGAVADLLLLDADPIEDPSVLWEESRRTVISGGRYLASV